MHLPVIMHSFNLGAKHKRSNVINTVLTEKSELFISHNCSRRKLKERKYINSFYNEDFTRGQQKVTVFSRGLTDANSIQLIQLEVLVPF